MTRSMTGFATRAGAAEGWTWTWDIRAVNGRGLDLRLRLPDQIDGVEVPLRAALQGRIGRGNVTVTLKLQRDATSGQDRLNRSALDAAIAIVAEVEERAIEADLSLRPSSAAELLAMRGILDAGGGAQEAETLAPALLADIDPLIDAFDGMRADEGGRLQAVIADQIDRIDARTREARDLLDARADHMTATFAAALDRLRGVAETVDEARIAQEIALIAVKADIAEELDRLDAHIAAARDLLAADGAKGRKLDFLTQEFNREANTLCSKAQFAELTRVGLDLKHTIDQMREQVQNVE